MHSRMRIGTSFSGSALLELLLLGAPPLLPFAFTCAASAELCISMKIGAATLVLEARGQAKLAAQL